jgi:hypothetical protein
MNPYFKQVQGPFLSLLVAAFAIAATNAAAKAEIFLGPPEAGTWSGSSKWLTGAYGAASTCYDFNDPSKGVCAFVISNSVAGKENAADWRCLPFSLGPAAGGARPIGFSFAYKLSEPVAAGNNLRVSLTFFDASGTNSLGARVYRVGAYTSDSAMTHYRTLPVNVILAPQRANMAVISINLDDTWVSGAGRFDDFTVSTVPLSFLFKAMIGAVILSGVGALTLLLFPLWRRRAGQNPVTAPGQP